MEFLATVESVAIETPVVKTLRFRVPEEFSFHAGQYVFIRLEKDGKPALRAYSIASSPLDKGHLDLCITKVEGGFASTFLHEVVPGAVLKMKGPLGLMKLHEDKNDALFIATGSGIAPFRSMIQYALAKGWKKKMDLVFGVRTVSDVMYKKEWEELERKHQNFHTLITFSRMPEDFPGERGYVQTKVARFASQKEHTDVYICGLGKMVLEVKAELLKQGFLERNIHFERYD